MNNVGRYADEKEISPISVVEIAAHCWKTWLLGQHRRPQRGSKGQTQIINAAVNIQSLEHGQL